MNTGLISWTTTQLALAPQDIHLELIAGDASPRRYYRCVLTPEHISAAAGSSSRVINTLIAVVPDAPSKPFTVIAVASPPTEKNPEFLRVQALLAAAGIRVPAVLAADVDQGFLLLEDLGNETLLPLLSDHSTSVWYAKALNILTDMAVIECRAEDHDHTLSGVATRHRAALELPPYDAARLQMELAVFPEWFVARLLGVAFDSQAQQVCRALSEVLVASALEQPQVVVHRDFHSRNLMVVNNADLAVIDFQDAVIGPITYDPVSLLKDCYIRWPRERQLAWLADHQFNLQAQGLMPAVSTQQFVRWFDLMGLQRHIKVLGVFARLYLRDGKPGYLKDLPLVLAYTREVLALYQAAIPAVAQFSHWFDACILPACAKESWYSDVPLTLDE